MLKDPFEFRVTLTPVEEGVMHLAWPENAQLDDQQRHSILEELVLRLQQDGIRVQPQGVSEPGFCYLHADLETWQEKPMVVSSVLSDAVHGATPGVPTRSWSSTPTRTDQPKALPGVSTYSGRAAQYIEY